MRWRFRFVGEYGNFHNHVVITTFGAWEAVCNYILSILSSSITLSCRLVEYNLVVLLDPFLRKFINVKTTLSI